MLFLSLSYLRHPSFDAPRRSFSHPLLHSYRVMLNAPFYSFIRVFAPRCHLLKFVNTLTRANESPGHQLLRKPFPRLDFRGAKTRASVKFDELPQGAIHLDTIGVDNGGPVYPTVLQQARLNMQKFENCVLLTRVGGFYELYFEHAEEFGPLMNLKVAQKRTSSLSVSMAGFPFFQLDRYLKILVRDLNRYVAIADEFPNDGSATAKTGGLLHNRRVSRIITPGTLIDESFMDPYTNNYVLAIHVQANTDLTSIPECGNPKKVASDILVKDLMVAGLAWLDLSTGCFFTQPIKISMLSSAISRIAPSEVVLDERLRGSHEEAMLSTMEEDNYLLSYSPQYAATSITDWNSMLETEVSLPAATEFTQEEIAAGSVLLNYVKTRLQELNMKIQPPIRYQATEIMGIDKHSMRALEIKETIRDHAFKGSLLSAIRRTVTKSGARLLNEWISSPSTSLSVINSRLELVSCMLENTPLREDIVSLLRRSHDSQRLVQKFSLSRGDPEDLIALANTIIATEELVSKLKQAQLVYETQYNLPGGKLLKNLVERIQLDGPSSLAAQIKKIIDEEGMVQRHQVNDAEAGEFLALAQEIAGSEGSSEDVTALGRGYRRKRSFSLKEHSFNSNDVWTMRPNASTILKSLHTGLEQLLKNKTFLSEELQARLGLRSLTLRWTPGLGHICHVKGKDTRVIAETRSVSSSKTTRCFHHIEWTKLGEKIDQTRVQIRAEEQHVFQRLREQVILNLIKLRRNAAVLDELDIVCSFAILAEEQSLVRPILNGSSVHKIVGGRHPVVHEGLREQGRNFVANDCFVGDQENIWLITGPNMGGKSTFLRQNALITIMAQVGSYVPAQYAEIGIVDQIFSRVGSADNLYRDQSTFMVEMLETATILRNASSRSFVIMDEIGRGTTPRDGVAVAFACLHHLYHINQCRTLFATHFHSLAELSEDMKRIGYYCTDIKQDERGGFNYVHRLTKGVNRESHALKVATLAGFPESALAIAGQILEKPVSKKPALD